MTPDGTPLRVGTSQVSAQPPNPADVVEALRGARAEVDRQAAVIQSLLEAIDGMEANVLQQAATIIRLEGQVKHLEGLVSAFQSAGVGNPTDGPDPRFRALRALIVKELHPDHAPAGSIDRALRAEVFKALWPKVEEITTRAA